MNREKITVNNWETWHYLETETETPPNEQEDDENEDDFQNDFGDVYENSNTWTGWERFYKITGLDDGEHISPYAISNKNEDLDYHLTCSPFDVRYYEEISRAEYLEMKKQNERFAVICFETNENGKNMGLVAWKFATHREAWEHYKAIRENPHFSDIEILEEND